MDIAGTVSALLAQKPVRQLSSIAPDATVLDAIALMAKENIGALPVISGGRLLGIITERDYTRKVILKGRSSKDTPVNEIMTTKLVLAKPHDSIAGCMKTMTESKVRHIPVVDGSAIVGILSIGDLVRWVIEAQAATIQQLESYMTGGVPG